MPSPTTNKELTDDPIAYALAQIEEINKPFSSYSEVAKDAIKGLIGSWRDEEERTEQRRRERKIDIDIDREKSGGVLDKDEVVIKMRLIDSNIRKELAKHSNYLTKSPRSVILSCNENQAADGSPIEKHFTTAARYNEWEKPLFSCIDGTETHAWDTVEILFDKTKPGHFEIDHCGHTDLIFSSDSKHIQANDFIIRRIEYTNQDLIKFVKEDGFSAIEVLKILQSATKDKSDKDTRDADTAELKHFQLQKIEKVFFKHEDGFVYVGWSCSGICDDWIRTPRKLFLGQVELNPNATSQKDQFIQLYETSYPIEINVYSISEDECIKHLEGRVSLDTDKQEAATSLMSSACTSYKRAAQLFWTRGDGSNDGTEIDDAQTDIKLQPNRVFNSNLKQFQLEAVSAEIFGAIYQIIGQSQQEAGDVNYAVQSNKSTRKTAAEINLAEKDNDMLSSVQVTLLSIFLRNVYTRCFAIYRSRILAGLIKCPDNVKQLLLEYTWTLKPAGDVDVIEREQKIRRMQSAWPVYQASGAKTVFLKQLTTLLFPDEAGLYLKALDDSEMQSKYLTSILHVLEGMIADAKSGEAYLQGDKMQGIMQLYQQGMMLLQQLTGAKLPSALPAASENLPVSEPEENVVPLPDAQEANV